MILRDSEGSHNELRSIGIVFDDEEVHTDVNRDL